MVSTIRLRQCLAIPLTLVAFSMASCGDKDDSGSDKSSEAQSKDIQGLKEQQKKAIADGDYEKALRIGIQIVSRSDEEETRKNAPSNLDQELSEIEKREKYMNSMVDQPDRSPIDLSDKCKKDQYCQRVAQTREMLASEIQKMSPRSPDYLRWHHVIELNHRNMQLKALNHDKSTRDLTKAYTSLLGVLDEVSLLMNLGGDCPENTAAKCEELQRKIPQLRTERDKLYAAGDLSGYNRLSVELSLAMDLLKLYQQGLSEDDKAVQQTKTRHQTLSEVVDGTRPAYGTLEKQEVDKVMNKFGHLYIKEGNSKEIEVKGRLPWAGYWYPFREGDTYIGEDAPLKKFDELLQKVGRTPQAVSWEKKHHEGHSWESSDGLCDAWAVAAALTKEPTSSVQYEGVSFSPAALKGLLIQKYANYEKERYGIPYRGFISTDGLAQDLRPEAFHKLVTEMLANGEAPVVDTDPNFPIWNMPLYRYSWKVEKDPEFDNAYIVTANAWYVKFRTRKSQEPTTYFGRGSDTFQSIYKYRLFVNPGEGNSKKGERVLYGEWILDDVASAYPDTVFQVSADTEPTPRNDVIGKNMDVLNELLQRVE